jgi:hypothetical protein
MPQWADCPALPLAGLTRLAILSRHLPSLKRSPTDSSSPRTPAASSRETSPTQPSAVEPARAIVPIEGHDCLHHTGGMLSFVSALTVDPTAGVGAFASVNASAEEGYRPSAVTRYAIQLLRAVREGKPLPAPPPSGSPTRLESAQALAGRFRSSEGESLELVVSGDSLALEQSGMRRPLQPGDEGSFIVVGPGEESSALLVRTRDGAVQSVGWGTNLYTLDGQAPAEPLPHELQRLAGMAAPCECRFRVWISCGSEWISSMT